MSEETIDYGQVTGMVHSTESFGAVDGPGIRFIVFLQGCHMRCQYCHNPDTWAMESNKSRERTVDDVLTEALRYRGFWGNKGGITVSGGEALLQIDFLIALFTKAKEHGSTVPWIPVPFLSVINHVTLRSLTNSWLLLTWFSWISRKSTKNSTRLSLAKPIKISWLVPSIYQILENLSGFATC